MQKTVAILGASSDRAKFGNKAVRAFKLKGYEVFPINPKEKLIEELNCYPGVGDLPVNPDIVSAYLPPPVLLKVLSAVAEKGCGELWLNPGTASDAVLAEADRLGLKVVQTCSILAIGATPSQFY